MSSTPNKRWTFLIFHRVRMTGAALELEREPRNRWVHRRVDDTPSSLAPHLPPWLSVLLLVFSSPSKLFPISCHVRTFRNDVPCAHTNCPPKRSHVLSERPKLTNEPSQTIQTTMAQEQDNKPRKASKVREEEGLQIENNERNRGRDTVMDYASYSPHAAMRRTTVKSG